MLAIRQTEYDALRRHGEETYPYECCGVLLGQFRQGDRIVERVVRCGNAHAERPHDRYQIDPAELIAIQRRATQQKLEIVGFYHSHPDHPAQWSKTDLAEAHWLTCSYVITALAKGVAAQTNSFVLVGESDDDKRFEAEAINTIAVGETLPLCR
jgi:proteasome lid subunit RPN8/RPN11